MTPQISPIPPNPAPLTSQKKRLGHAGRQKGHLDGIFFFDFFLRSELVPCVARRQVGAPIAVPLPSPLLVGYYAYDAHRISSYLTPHISLPLPSNAFLRIPHVLHSPFPPSVATCPPRGNCFSTLFHRTYISTHLDSPDLLVRCFHCQVDHPHSLLPEVAAISDIPASTSP